MVCFRDSVLSVVERFERQVPIEVYSTIGVLDM